MTLCFGSVLAEPRVWPVWTAKSSDGTVVESRQLDGKVVLISVWGSWCPSCQKQLPVLDMLQDVIGRQNLQVIGFSFDRTVNEHNAYVQKSGLKLPSVYARSGDGLDVVRTLQKGAGPLVAVPTLLIYDKRGQLAHRLVGFYNRKNLEDLINPLLTP